MYVHKFHVHETHPFEGQGHEVLGQLKICQINKISIVTVYMYLYQQSNFKLLKHQKQKMNFQTYMPYLTLWDKTSQNSARLKAISQMNFQISQNF